MFAGYTGQQKKNLFYTTIMFQDWKIVVVFFGRKDRRFYFSYLQDWHAFATEYANASSPQNIIAFFALLSGLCVQKKYND
jgi:hypothetical protein